MANEVRIEARPWEPQDLIDDLQMMIDEQPDSYLNGDRTTLCMARDYLKTFFAEESLRPKGRWAAINADCRGYANAFECSNCETISHTHTYMKECEFEYCPVCGAKMEG